jgi:hypothetical protein
MFIYMQYPGWQILDQKWPGYFICKYFLR